MLILTPLARRGVVIGNICAKYGLSPSSDRFLGGDSSYVELLVAYPKNGIMSKKEMNTIIELNEEDIDKQGANWIYETVRIPAFKFENPREEMCYQQFRTMHWRFKKAGTVRIEWMTPHSCKRYTQVNRINYDGSGALNVYPNRITIVKKKIKVPGK